VNFHCLKQVSFFITSFIYWVIIQSIFLVLDSCFEFEIVKKSVLSKINVYNMTSMLEQVDIELNLLIQIEFKYPEVDLKL